MALTHGVASERAEYFNVPSYSIHGPLPAYERRLTPFKRHENAGLYRKSSRVLVSFVLSPAFYVLICIRDCYLSAALWSSNKKKLSP